MGRLIKFGCAALLILSIAQGAYGQEGAPDEFPLVWVSATDLLYAGGASDGDYIDVFHLAYKYSSDWVLITADEGIFDEDGITYKNGLQYAFTQDGKNLSEMSFTSLVEAVDFASMESASLGEDGSILTPFTGARIGFAVAQVTDGALSQIALAKETEEYKGNLHLFDGFLYQFDSDLNLTTQVAFSEISFGTEGLLHSSVVAPSPAAEAPVYIESHQPAIVPYTESSVNPESGASTAGGTEETLLLSIPKDYDVPPIAKIGVVMFTDHSGNPDLIVPATEKLADLLGEIEGLEVKTMEFDTNTWGGGVMLDRAVELGKEYAVDAFILPDLLDFAYPSKPHRPSFVQEVKISCEMEFAVVDCTGGRVFWRTAVDHSEFAQNYELEENEENILRYILKNTIKEGVDRLIADDVLAGGPVDKEWENES